MSNEYTFKEWSYFQFIDYSKSLQAGDSELVNLYTAMVTPHTKTKLNTMPLNELLPMRRAFMSALDDAIKDFDLSRINESNF